MSPPVGAAVAIPHPKPNAIPSPIPPQGEAQVPQTQTPVAPTPGPTQAPVSSDDLFAQAEAARAPGQSAPQVAPGQPVTPGQGSQDTDSLFSQAEAMQSGNTRPGEEIDESAAGASLTSRVTAESLGRSPEEQRRLLQNSLGGEFETKLGGKDGREVLFRKQGESKFSRMDPGFFNSLSDFGKDMAAVAGHIGIDAVSAIAGEALGIAGGAAVAGPAGAVAGGIAGAGAGGVVASAGREAAIRGLGVEPAVDFRRDAAFNALLNSATVGVGGLLKTPIKAVVGKITDALAETPFARLNQLAKIREGVDELQNQIGKASLTPRGPNAALGKEVKSAADVLADQLGDQISAVTQKAQAVAGSQTFPVRGYQKRLTEILQGEGVVINPNGLAEIPHGLEATKPFGAPEGMAALKQMVSDYNVLTRGNGTMNMKTLLNTLSYYKSPAGFTEKLPSAVNGAYQALRGSLREERDQIIPHVLDGTPEGEFAQSAYANYANKIDGLRTLQEKALRRGSPEKFAESLIAPKDSAGVQSLKSTFGEDSAQFSSIKSAWFSGVVTKAVDPETGLVSGQILKRELGRYGDDVVAELLSPAQRNALTVLANNAEKVSYDGLVKNPENSEFLRRVAGAFVSGNGSHPEGTVRMLWSLFSNNKAAMDVLANEGLLNYAKGVADPAGRTGAVRAAQWLQRAIAASDIVVAKDGRKAYHLPVEMPVFSALINAHEKQDNESAQQFLLRKSSAVDDLRNPDGGH